MSNGFSLKECIGGVPIVIRLASQDIVHASQKPAPVAFVLPRTTLLIAVLKDILHMFAPYTVALNKFSTQAWLGYDNMPIPWIYPIGAVKDYVTELRRWKDTESMLGNVDTNESETNNEREKKDITNNTLQKAYTLMAQPVEMEFHIHPQSRSNSNYSSAKDRVIHAIIDYEHLDAFIRNEIRQWHKATYTALYGTYKYYHNLPESLLLPLLALALYRPFDTNEQRSMNLTGSSNILLSPENMYAHTSSSNSSSKQYGENTERTSANLHSTKSATPEAALQTSSEPLTSSVLLKQTSNDERSVTRNSDEVSMNGINTSLPPELTSPYLLAEYQHILEEKMNRPRVSFVLSVALPFVAYLNKERNSHYNQEQSPLIFELCRVSATPLNCTTYKPENEVDTDNNDNANEITSSLYRERELQEQQEQEQCCLVSVTAATTVNRQELSAEHEELDTIPLGLLIWRAFRVPYFRWMRYKREQETDQRKEQKEYHREQQQQQQQQEREEEEEEESKRVKHTKNVLKTANKESCHNNLRDMFFTALSFCYEAAPQDAINAEQEGLRTTLPSDNRTWADWEAQMVKRLVKIYDTHGIFIENDNTSNKSNYNNKCSTINHELSCNYDSTPIGAVSNDTQLHANTYCGKRVYFQIQGIQPPLCVPASFIESYFTSSDRVIYITVLID